MYPLRRIMVIALLPLFLAACWETGNGEKVGTITRLNKRGFFCQTWEGEIIRGGLNTGSGVMGAAFHFTIEDQRLVPIVQKMMDTQQEVKIRFRSEAISFCRSDSNSYFLVAIEPLTVVSSPPVQSSAPVSRDPTLEQLLQQNNALLTRLLEKEEKK